MKKLIIFFINITILLYNDYIYCAQHIVDRIIAIVNNDIILESDIEEVINKINIPGNKIKGHQENVFLRNQVINQLIDDCIIKQLARVNNVFIDSNKLNYAIYEIAKRNHMTVDQLRNNLLQDGIDYDTFQKKILKNMILSEVLLKNNNQNIAVLPEEINSLIQQFSNHNSNPEFNLIHVVVFLPENPDPNQVEKAKIFASSLIKKFHNEKTLKLLNIHFTRFKTFKINQIKWKKTTDLPSLFSPCLIGSRKGEVVGPIQSDIGIHMMKILDIRNNDKKELITTVVKTRHIFLKSSKKISNQANYNRIYKIAKNIEDNKISFNDAAVKFSEDFSSACYGGDLGWRLLSTFEFPIRKAITLLKKFEISKPIRSSSGWHIFQITDKKNSNYFNFIYREPAYNILFNERLTKNIQQFLQKQRNSSYIKIINN